MKTRQACMLLPLLLFVVLASAPAQENRSPEPLSVTILLDLSYSMRLPLSLNKDDRNGMTRLEEAKRLLKTLLGRSVAGTRWSLFTFGGTPEPSIDSAVRLRHGFTSNESVIASEISGLSTWGVSPLGSAILSADGYSDRNAAGRQRVLLVVSDGIDTLPSLFEMPSPRVLREFRTRIVFAGIALKDSVQLLHATKSWATKAGGAYVDAGDHVAVERAIRRLGESSLSDGTPPRQVAAAATSESALPSSASTRQPAAARTRGSILRRPVLLLLIPIPLLLLGLFLRSRRRRLERNRSLRTRTRVHRFRFEAHDDIFDREILELPAELVLGRSSASTAPVIEAGRESLVMISATPVLVNGVAVRRAGIREGDRIRIGSALWTYRGAELRDDGPTEPGSTIPIVAAAAAAMMVAVILIVGLGTPGAAARAYPLTSVASSPVRSTPGVSTAGPSPVGAVAGREHEPPLIPKEIALAGGLGTVRPFVHTQMIAPGQRPEFFKADVMFIHTHPDDDSIDFGGLMALESRAGKSVVTIVFTDGNAGLDQYPERRVGGIYPAHPLRGDALAKVRVHEADAALSILGAREYIRLGLLNNPYDSIREILPLHEVLRRWGGEAYLVRKLAGLIEGFRPQIVVSPDEHHRGVFKHFEHEAVGYITDRTLIYLHARGMDFVRAHLIGIDPMLTGQYRDVFGVNVLAVDPRSGLTYRAIQVAALKEHATQRDASVIGVEVVPNFSHEYYVARSWELPDSPNRYFAGPARSRGG